MDRAEPIAAYQEIETIAARRASQQEDNTVRSRATLTLPEPCSTRLAATIRRFVCCSATAHDTAIDRYESRLREFRAGEQVARSADDR
jgi:hypothetical protein